MSSKYLELKPHDFRYPIKIFKYVTTEVNQNNIPIDSKEKLTIKARAAIRNTGGKEIEIADGVSLENKKRFYIRYRNIGFSTKNAKIEYNGSIYDIKSISDVEEAHKVFEIVAELIE